MTTVHGISYLPTDVQEFVREQFTETQCPKSICFVRNDNDDKFTALYCYSTDRGEKNMYLTHMNFTANHISNGITRHDMYDMSFSEKKPETPKGSITGTEVEIEIPPPIDAQETKKEGKLIGGKWNGYPMSDEISQTEALYAACKMDSVYIKGKKLVLRNGAWHKN